MYAKRSLSNGFKVIVSPMPQMESVSLGIWIGVGGRYESEKTSGISHLVEHMLFKGTSTRSTKQLKEAIEGVGGALNGFTADEVTCYMVKVPAAYMKLGFDVLADMVFDPKFDEKELAKEKFVILEEIKMYKDQPAEHVVEVLAKLMWPENALGRPLTGTVQTVQRFTREELVAFKEKNYHPSNMAVVATGKVATEDIFNCVSEKFKCNRQKKPMFEVPRSLQKGPRFKYLRKDVNQSQLAMGFHIDSADMKDRFALKIMNIILGGNMSSRLFEELREKYGLCYDIASAYKRHSDVGEFLIHAGVDNAKALRSAAAIIDELLKLKDLGITDDELVRAKEYAKGQFLLSLESTSSRMMWFGYRLLVDKYIPEVKELIKRIDDVTKEEVKKVSEHVFRSNSINLAMIGDVNQKQVSKIRAELEKL